MQRISLRHYQKIRKQSQVSEKYQEIPTEQKSTNLNSILIRRSSFSNTLLQYQKLKTQAEEEKKLHMRRETKFVQVNCDFREKFIDGEPIHNTVDGKDGSGVGQNIVYQS